MNGGLSYTGEEIPFPETYPMAEIPPGGYQGSSIPPEVAGKLLEFDQAYTTMLKQLQSAWETGQLSKLNGSIGTMHGLSDIATELMQMEISPGGPTYGPCFRIVE
jgi:hypothetical protein